VEDYGQGLDKENEVDDEWENLQLASALKV
jgi:hypothetical protein